MTVEIDVIEDGHIEGGEVEAGHAVVFPWFVEAVGLFVFFIMAKWFKLLPYTAVMFILGMVMGIGAVRAGNDDQLSQSISMWINIDSEVLLLVFLPGLLFRDALNVNLHLFEMGLSQILLLAFPMVLAGTCLTALVGYHGLPYGWSWFLSLTFGSILSATDPVAVAALLAEVGAPPRLTMHISGESMFNDGSAIVFFNIFSGMFLYELGIDGIGEQVTLGEGFAMFFQLSLGGVAIGLAFAIGLCCVLYMLDQKLNTENNVVQVAATVTTAYLAFYTSEVSSGCSGVIAVVVCGITTRAFGGGFINDPQMMESFWVLLEHLLNTLLFSLGGCVWGSIIANADDRDAFEGKDWGYLVVLYIYLTLIRFALIACFYPIVSRIGLKSNWQESFFMSFGGLRGAVGIALALAIDNDVRSATDDPEKRALTNKLFGMVGGVALLTLVVNGTLAGPVLKKLGLASSSEATEKIEEHYYRLLRKKTLGEYSMLMTDSRFQSCNYHLIRHHLLGLGDVTDAEFDFARQQASDFDDHNETLKGRQKERKVALANIKTSKLDPPKLEGTETFGEKELRLLFLELLKGAYEVALQEGYLDARVDNGLLHFSLLQSLDFAKDEINRGGPISDWKFTKFSEIAAIDNFAKRISNCMNRATCDREKQRITLLKAFEFQSAHRNARRIFQEEFLDDADDAIAEAAQIILKESEEQEKLASEVLSAIDSDEMQLFVSHYACSILLNKVALLVQKHNKSGAIRDQSANEVLEDVDKCLREVNLCTLDHEEKEEKPIQKAKDPVKETPPEVETLVEGQESRA